MAAFLDLIGQRFGRLLVIGRAERSRNKHSRWICRCDCGRETVVLGPSLTNLACKSCGCLRREKAKARMTPDRIPIRTLDLTGRRFGRLIAICPGERRNGQTAWMCECVCGQKRTIQTKILLRGESRSCGCLRRESAAEMLAERRVGNEPGLRYCVQCGAEFPRVANNKIYCSGRCRSRNRQRPAERKQRYCQHCGKAFEVPWGQNNVFCSAHCRRIRRNAYALWRRHGRSISTDFEIIKTIIGKACHKDEQD